MRRLFLAGLLLLGACSQEEPQSRPVVVALQSEGQTLDPHVAADAASMRLCENLYSTLVRQKSTPGEIEPDLAERIDVSKDGLAYTVHLRHDAYFHVTGRRVTAADVKYSVDRIEKIGVRAENFAAVRSIETPDDFTVVFHLREPFAPFENDLAHPMNAVVDRAIVKKNEGRLDSADAGCGPFRLVEWRRNQSLVMERDARYYRKGLPEAKRIEMRPIPDETARITALRTGAVDVVLDVPPRYVETLQGAPHVTVQSVAGTFWEYVGLNVKRKPFDDRRVRQAVAWAVDRDEIDRLVKRGRATVLRGGPLPPQHWAHLATPVYPAPDRKKAKALLAEAGYPHGFSATLKVGSDFPYQVKAAEVLKQQLRRVGIDLKLESLESTIFFHDLGAHDFQMTLVGWIGQVDPDQWLYSIFHTGGKYNQQGYSNPEVDALLDKGRRVLDRKERAAIYREAQRRIATDAPMVFLYANRQIAAVRDDVAGFTVFPTASTLALVRTHRVR